MAPSSSPTRSRAPTADATSSTPRRASSRIRDNLAADPSSAPSYTTPTRTKSSSPARTRISSTVRAVSINGVALMKQRTHAASAGEELWTEESNEALLRLALIPDIGKRTVYLSKDSKKGYGRNGLLSKYIRRHTGVVRNKVQCASHMAVWGKNNPDNSGLLALIKGKAMSPSDIPCIGWVKLLGPDRFPSISSSSIQKLPVADVEGDENSISERSDEDVDFELETDKVAEAVGSHHAVAGPSFSPPSFPSTFVGSASLQQAQFPYETTPPFQAHNQSSLQNLPRPSWPTYNVPPQSSALFQSATLQNSPYTMSSYLPSTPQQYQSACLSRQGPSTASILSPQQQPLDPTNLLPTLTAFLTSISPSLASLAPSFLSAGISSFSDLVSFFQFDSGTRKAMYDEMGKKSGSALTDKQVQMLEQGLAGAAEEGRKRRHSKNRKRSIANSRLETSLVASIEAN
ncbi:hypothetical protein JCM8547_008925 [Rhodosporidiobolus lusitaniae]